MSQHWLTLTGSCDASPTFWSGRWIRAAPPRRWAERGSSASTGARGDFSPAADFPLPLDLLVGVERQKQAVLQLIERFSRGVSTNHALLWGSRGAGKSSLVKAALSRIGEGEPLLRLVEVAADDLDRLPAIFSLLEGRSERVVVLCDDLSFEEGAAGAKALKSTLEGGVAGPPENVLIVATSNRRHLMPRSHDGDDALAAAEDAEGEPIDSRTASACGSASRPWTNRLSLPPCAPTRNGST